MVYTQNQTPKLEKENYFSGHAWRSLSGSQLSNRVRRLQSQKQLCQVSSHHSVPLIPRLLGSEAGSWEPPDSALRAQHSQFGLSRDRLSKPRSEVKSSSPAVSSRPLKTAPFPLNPLRGQGATCTRPRASPASSVALKDRKPPPTLATSPCALPRPPPPRPSPMDLAPHADASGPSCPEARGLLAPSSRLLP